MVAFLRHLAIAIAVLFGTAGAASVPRESVLLYVDDARWQEDAKGEAAETGQLHEAVMAMGGPVANRATILTGCLPLRAGVVTESGARAMIQPQVPLVSDAFRAAGYQTAFFGEWGLGDNLPFRPQDRGFEVSGALVRSDESVVGEALKWLKERAAKDRPIFLCVSVRDGTGKGLKALRTGAGMEAGWKQMMLHRVADDAGESRFRWQCSGFALKRASEYRLTLADVFPTLAGGVEVPMFRDWSGDGMDVGREMREGGKRLANRALVIQKGGWSMEISPDRMNAKHFRVIRGKWAIEGPRLINLESKQGEVAETEENVTQMTELLLEYSRWWKLTRPLLEPQRVIVGDERQPLLTLDWRTWWPSLEPQASQSPEKLLEPGAFARLLEQLGAPEQAKQLPSVSGHWKLQVQRDGHYRVLLRKLPADAETLKAYGAYHAGPIHLRSGKQEVKSMLAEGATSIALGIDLEKGPADLEAWVEGQGADGRIFGVFYATIERVGDRRMPNPEWKVSPK